MAIRRANILGILNEMYQAENKEYTADRDFAIKGMSIAIDKQDKEKARALEKRKVDITEANSIISRQKAEADMKYQDSLIKDKEEKKIMDGLKSQLGTNLTSMQSLQQSLGTQIYNKVIKGGLPSSQAPNGGTGNPTEMKAMRKAFTENGFTEKSANAIMEWSLGRSETGVFNPDDTNVILFEIFGNPGMSQFLATEYDLFGSNIFTVEQIEKQADDYFKFSEQNSLINQELQEYNLTGDSTIGDPLYNLLHYGNVDGPGMLAGDLVIENDDTTMLGNSETIQSFLNQDTSVLTDEEEINDILGNKNISGVPTEVLKIQESLGSMPSTEEGKKEYFNKIEDILNKNSSKWTEYKTDNADVNTLLAPRKNYKKARNYGLDIIQERNKSTAALKEWERKIYEKETLHNSSNDEQFFYSDAEKDNDAKVSYLYKLQLGLLDYHQKVANKREENLYEVMSGAGKFFSGANMDKAFQKLEEETGVSSQPTYGIPFQRRNR